MAGRGNVRALRGLGDAENAPLLTELLRQITALRDDTYNAAAIANPAHFAAGDPSSNPAPRTFAPNGGGVTPSSTQVLYTNTSDRPVLLCLRAVADDFTEFALLYGMQNKPLNLAAAAGLQFTRFVNAGVVVRPNGVLSAAAISQTGNVLVNVLVVPLRGAGLALDGSGAASHCFSESESDEDEE